MAQRQQNNRDDERRDWRGQERDVLRQDQYGERGARDFATHDDYDRPQERGYGRDYSWQQEQGRGGEGYNDYGSNPQGNRQGKQNRQMGRNTGWDGIFGENQGGYPGRGSQQQGGFSGRGPKGYQRSDERLREEVNDRLTWNHEVDASNIEVKVEGGEVTLEGTVDDRQQKREAEECCYQVSGVKDVHNHLRIQQSSAPGGLKMDLKGS